MRLGPYFLLIKPIAITALAIVMSSTETINVSLEVAIFSFGAFECCRQVGYRIMLIRRQNRKLLSRQNLSPSAFIMPITAVQTLLIFPYIAFSASYLLAFSDVSVELFTTWFICSILMAALLSICVIPLGVVFYYLHNYAFEARYLFSPVYMMFFLAFGLLNGEGIYDAFGLLSPGYAYSLLVNDGLNLDIDEIVLAITLPGLLILPIAALSIKAMKVLKSYGLQSEDPLDDDDFF